MEQKIRLADLNATENYAAELADTIEKGSILLLYGDCGAGKSSFARAFIRSRLGDADLAVPSPTFTLIQDYEGTGEVIVHMDLYRLHDPEEIEAIDWQRILESDVTALVEWPDRLPDCPDEALQLHFATEGNGRVVTVKGGA